MDTVQSYKCPCCGELLVFLGEQLRCDACGNSFSLETVQQVAEGTAQAEAASKYDWTKYTPRSYEDSGEVCLADYNCPACGAQITGDDTLGAAVCPYCGNSTIVKRQFAGTLRPDYIIPFKLDKKAALAAFEAEFKNAPFLPDAFKSKKKLEETEGVYVPCWMFDCDCNAAVTYNAQRVSHWSDARYSYTKTDHFKLFRSGTIGFANLPVDGSKKTDDAYMEALEPYNYAEAVEFNAAYLSGYFADKYDVPAEESSLRANERVKNSTVDAFSKTTGGYMSVQQESANVQFSNGKIRYALLPVWMLNFKYKGQNYAFAVNGQTGKVVGNYPVDKAKQWKYFAKVAGIGYAIVGVLALLLLWGGGF